MKLYIMRGVSGSGKSTKAHEILTQAQSNGLKGIICSADKWFVSDDGTYEFKLNELRLAHLYCKAQADTAMQLGTDVIIIDNTNTTRREYGVYVDLADKYGYEVKMCVVGKLDEDSLKLYASRNLHGVTLEVVKKQANRFEK